MKNQSEVASLLEQIAAEYQAAEWALTGLSQGTAQHAFINGKMERMWGLQGDLGELVGKDEAFRLFSDQLDNL